MDAIKMRSPRYPVSAAEHARLYGLTVRDISRSINRSAATLNNWNRDEPALFEAIAIGVAFRLEKALPVFDRARFHSGG